MNKASESNIGLFVARGQSEDGFENDKQSQLEEQRHQLQIEPYSVQQLHLQLCLNFVYFNITV